MGFGGKGKGKGSWGMMWAPVWQSWGKGKGKGSISRKTDPAKKVWIGGLPAGSRDQAGKDLNKALQEHMKAAGECKFAEISKTGTGSACFATEEEVQNAIATLNGSDFQGNTIEVDVWTKKEK